MAERFDAIVVGAGPAGVAAAYTMAKGGLSVLLLERGEFPGAKNVFGGVLYRHHLEGLIPQWWKQAPLERTIVEENYWLLDDEGAVKVGHRSQRYNGELPNAFTAYRAKFDPWFAGQAEAAGVLLICETTVTELLLDGERVVGVKVDREEGEVYANAVIIADGVNSLLAKQLGAHKEWRADEVSLVVKETLGLPKEKILDRFGLEENEGATIEIIGAPSQGMTGMGFLYTNKESLSLGLGIMVNDLQRTGAKPYELLEQMKRHPALRKLLQGAELKEYAAHLIPEGGFNSLPRLAGPGWLLVGDAAQMVNFVHREGTNLAIHSGRLAGETVLEMHEQGDFSAAAFQAYRQKVELSFIYQDLAKYQRLPEFLHSQREFIMNQLPKAANDSLYSWFNVDARTKAQAQKEIGETWRRAAGGTWNLLKLGLKGWRAINR